MLKKLKLLFPILLILNSLLIGQVNHKIMSYNLLNYPGTDTTTRNPYFRTTIASVLPDILIVQEITSLAGVNGFLNNVLNTVSSDYAAGTFIDGPDTDSEIFYKSAAFTFLANNPISTSLRNINEFVLRENTTGDTLRIYSVHLKASSGTTNEQRRLSEVTMLRNYTDALPLGKNYLVCGDFNIYGSNEPAYQKLLDKTTSGYFIDLFNLPGTWNQAQYAPYHTQSTRTRAFGGGATGGLDDRFDMMLFSQAVIDTGGITYVTNSYTPYGNDGLHYNDSINRPPNAAVGQQIADALHYTSDHLPVFATFKFEGVTSVQLADAVNILYQFVLNQNYPNPFNPNTTISFSIPLNGLVQLKVFNLLGQELAVLVNEEKQAGSYEAEFKAENMPSGVYFYQLKAGDFIQTKKMILLK